MKQKKDVIIFDGICKMCNAFFRWVHKNDKKNVFMFTNIQSKFYSENSNIDKSKDSIIVITKNKILYDCDAIVYILKITKTQLVIRFIISIFPRFISNFFYQIIARNRYDFFGKKDTCYIPSKAELKRFIN